jgi:hypothetical protein
LVVVDFPEEGFSQALRGCILLPGAAAVPPPATGGRSVAMMRALVLLVLLHSAAAPCSTLQHGVDFFNTDHQEIHRAASPAECYAICEKDASCKAFTFQTELGRCYTKGSNRGSRGDAACVSGCKGPCPPTAPAAPPASKVYACQTARTKAMGFCDSSRSFVERASDLLQRLTTAEKLSLMGAHGRDICAFEDGGVARLDIPSYTWCTETNTGVSSVCLQEGRCATTFPSPAALASTFNRSLWRRKGEIQSTEQRALFNLGAVRGSSTHPLIGLNG